MTPTKESLSTIAIEVRFFSDIKEKASMALASGETLMTFFMIEEAVFSAVKPKEVVSFASHWIKSVWLTIEEILLNWLVTASL